MSDMFGEELAFSERESKLFLQSHLIITGTNNSFPIAFTFYCTYVQCRKQIRPNNILLKKKNLALPFVSLS
jgi:hypothetical protein